MNLSSAQRCLQIITATDAVTHERSENRAKISRLINGFPPVDEIKAKKLGLDIVFNGGDAQNSFRSANLQFFNAFQSRNNYFTISVPSAPEEYRYDLGLQLTEFVNKPMKRSAAYSNMLDQQFASVVMHGIGPQFWLSRDKWCPEFCALKEWRVATDTNTSLDNMVWNARLVRYTMGELAQRVYGKYASKGWNKKAIGNILNEYQPINWEATDLNYSWATNPERYYDLIKQNLIAYTSDAVPTINLWHFYHLDQTDPLNKKIYMKVVPKISCKGATQDTFLFESKTAEADCWEQLIHVQFGDLNGDPPFKIHAVRSLGFMLHEPAFWLSLMRCRSFQHTWENFQMLMQSDAPPDKARGQKFELFKGWLPTGMRIIPEQERHQIDARLLEFNMAQAKQMIGESSSAYTQALDNGTQKERTLGEVQAQMQTLNQAMQGIIGIAARNRKASDREVCRRFCNAKSIDPDVREFWKNCKKAKIPIQYINHDLWDIEPDMPIGAGNQTLEIAKAMQLMAVRGAHGPEAQNLILHIHDAAVTGNAKLAQLLAPIGEKQGITTAQRDAESVFGTLMAGADVQPREGLNPIDQLDAMFGMAQQVVTQIESTGNMATMPQAAGLANVIQYITALIGLLAQDEQQKEVVALSVKALTKLQNDLKGFTQRIAQQQAKNGENGQNGESAAKIQAMIIQAQSKAEIDNMKAANKEKNKNLSLQLTEMRKNIQALSQLDRDAQVHQQELLINRMDALQSMMIDKTEAENSVSNGG